MPDTVAAKHRSPEPLTGPIPVNSPSILPINPKMAGPDYILDLGSGDRRRDGEPARAEPASTTRSRPWLAVHWKCCHVYSRVYRDRKGIAYTGTCPRCGKPVRIPIGPDGTDCRFFEAF